MESDTARAVDSSTTDDSIHMQLLQKALEKTTSKCVSSFKFSLLKRHFEPIYKKDPKTLKKLHEGAAEQLTANITEELGMMFEEENILQFMTKLDEMKAQADDKNDLVAWRPSGNPEKDVRAHIQPIHHQHLHQLQKIFDQLQSQNSMLQQLLKKEQGKLMESRSAIQGHLNTWKKANCLTAKEHMELENFVNKL